MPCDSSCASGKVVILDTGEDTPWSYSTRTAHELGHIASDQLSQLAEARSCSDYSLSGPYYQMNTREHSCASYEEGFAQFIGDVSRYSWNASASADVCLTGQIEDCSIDYDTSYPGGVGCNTDQGRWPLSVARFFWDLYDGPGDSDSIGEPYYRIVENNYNFLLGSANNQRDEPFSPDGTVADQDGKGVTDYKSLYNSTYSIDLSVPYVYNCSTPGD